MHAKNVPFKYAVLSMDVEDWYHTGYLNAGECRRDVSLLDGLDIFVETLGRHGIQAQLFILSDLLRLYPDKFRKLAAAGHEMASHGTSHIPPLQLTPLEFCKELEGCVRAHREILGQKLNGFRATRFMLDRERLEIVRDAELTYDSSLICRKIHEDFDLQGFKHISKHILCSNGFYEYRLANFSRLGLHWPVAGGGAMRILPWWMTALPLSIQGRNLELYSFYIHPLDVSKAPFPPVPEGTSRLARWRMNRGRGGMAHKLEKLIALLQSQGFKFTTYRDLGTELTSRQNQLLQSAPASAQAASYAK